MTNEKLFFPIHVAFFKGFAGIVISVILFYLTLEISIIGILVGSGDPILEVMKVLNDGSQFFIFLFPMWYWVFYPIMIYVINRDNYDISNL